MREGRTVAEEGGGTWERALAEIVGKLKREGMTRDDVNGIKLEVARRYSLPRVPSNDELLRVAQDERLRRMLMRRPSRILSGIAVVTVAAKPYRCPTQAHCIYCPGGIRYGTPQSYTPESPSVIHASRYSYDPRKQVESHLAAFERRGYPTSKVEVVIVGGTFLYYPQDYREEFIRGIFEGLNGREHSSLEEAHSTNEISMHRCVGLTVETRPDFCREEHVDRMLSYGTTRVEIGAQILDDDVLRLVKRGHTVDDVVEAIRIAKDAGLKVGIHMMPCLPGSDREKDLKSFWKLFNDERFKPDMLKIYPTLVMKTAPLYRLYLKGRYDPCTTDEVVDLIIDVKRMVPPWLRIMRIQREIPPRAIVAGPNMGSLRQLVQEELKRRGLRCRCIRCREVGRNRIEPTKIGQFKLTRRMYHASEGREYFLSFEDDEERLAAFLRLRVPSVKAHRSEIKERPAAIVRELRVYGMTVDVGDRDVNGWQHRGLGRRLMVEAERIAREELGMDKLVVISAVGTRGYYRKLGYERDGPYMSKMLDRYARVDDRP